MTDIETSLNKAAKLVRKAEGILVGTGAGMGVDSGLPDFRGNEGFWKAYPPLAKLEVPFTAMANPQWFDYNPELAWGFYGHRLNLYRQTTPHEGFDILLRLANEKRLGGFVFTSNVQLCAKTSEFGCNRVVDAGCAGRLCQNTLQLILSVDTR